MLGSRGSLAVARWVRSLLGARRALSTRGRHRLYPGRGEVAAAIGAFRRAATVPQSPARAAAIQGGPALRATTADGRAQLSGTKSAMAEPGNRIVPRLVGAYLAGVVGLGLVLWLVVAHWAQQRSKQQLLDQLEAEARLLASVVATRWTPDEPRSLLALFPPPDDSAAVRYTILNLDGTVIADTLEPADRMGSQRGRPEVRAALKAGQGGAQQPATWAATPVVYWARTVGEGQARLGLVRVARPLPATETILGQLRRGYLMGWGGLALTGLALVGGWARRMAQGWNSLSDGLRRLARGEAATVRFGGDVPEFAPLSDRLAEAAQSIDQRTAVLREQSDRLATVLGGMIEGVIAVDQRQHILFANPAARTLLELHASDGAGRPIWEVVRNRAVQQAAEEALRSTEPCSLEFEMAGKTRRVLSLYGTRLPGLPPRGAVLVLHDVTELRRLENLRQEFVANVSHELKTPLTAIKAYAETLLGGALHDGQHNQEFVRRIAEQAERLHELILDLLSLARIEAGQEHFEIEVVPLEQLVESCLAQHRASAQARNLLLEVHPSEAPLAVLADREGLREILDNLVDNAMKYTPEGGRVSVAWSNDEGQVRIDVADTGIGISPDEQTRIFERFYRVDKARSRELGGTGLGLSIVKHLAQAFGGRVSVSSQFGRGSRFSVWLPAAGEAALNATADVSRSDDQSGGIAPRS